MKLADVRHVLSKLMLMSRAELERLHGSRQATVLEASVAAIMLRTMNRGETNGLMMVFDRLFGKVPITTENINVQATYSEAIAAARGMEPEKLAQTLRLAKIEGKVE